MEEKWEWNRTEQSIERPFNGCSTDGKWELFMDTGVIARFTEILDSIDAKILA